MVNFPTVTDIENLPDPAPDWLWTMTIGNSNGIFINRLRVMDVNFPFTYIEPVQRYRAGNFLSFTGHSNIDTVTVSVYESEDFAVLQAFEAWQSLIIDSNGNYGLPANFLGIVTLINYDFLGNPRLQCDLSGCWPSRLSDWSLNYTSSGHLTVQVIFAINNSNFSFLGASGATLVPSGNATM